MGSKQGENTPRSMDRRSFFKLGGLTAGAAALTGGMLAGCAPQNPTEMAQTGGENETVAASVPYAVYDTDILLIGGGFGASFAMQEACKAGKNMLVIDKAPYGFGGAFGMSFDIMQTWVPGAYYETEEEVPVATKIRNDSLYRKTGVQNEVELNPDVVVANWGEILSARNEDGTPFYIYDFPTTRGFEHSMTRHWSDYFRSKDYVTVHDRTMITDLIIEDGLSGWLCSTVPQLAEALGRITPEMGAAAQRRINEHFLWQNSAELALTLLPAKGNRHG